jgi:hypothetical protein
MQQQVVSVKAHTSERLVSSASRTTRRFRESASPLLDYSSYDRCRPDRAGQAETVDDEGGVPAMFLQFGWEPPDVIGARPGFHEPFDDESRVGERVCGRRERAAPEMLSDLYTRLGPGFADQLLVEVAALLAG